MAVGVERRHESFSVVLDPQVIEGELARARETVLERHTWTHRASRIVELFEEALERR